MMTKQKYIDSQRAKEQWARTLGYNSDEIKEAYKINREGRIVSYIDDMALQSARKNIQNAKRNL